MRRVDRRRLGKEAINKFGEFLEYTYQHYCLAGNPAR